MQCDHENRGGCDEIDCVEERGMHGDYFVNFVGYKSIKDWVGG